MLCAVGWLMAESMELELKEITSEYLTVQGLGATIVEQ